MSSKSINITVDEDLIKRSDDLVAKGKYANRSQFVQASIKSMLKKIDAEAIGEQAKLLNAETDSEEWFEGELESWREQY